MVYAKFNGVHKTKLLYGTKKEKSVVFFSFLYLKKFQASQVSIPWKWYIEF